MARPTSPSGSAGFLFKEIWSMRSVYGYNHDVNVEHDQIGQKWTDRLFLIAFVLLTAGSLVPIWLIRILPMQDVWQHLALVDIIHNYNAPGSIYPDYFLLPDVPKPNLFYYYMTSWLGYITPSLEFANKVLLSAYVITFPLSYLYLLRSFDRSKWLALFVFPFVFNAMFYLGFVAFLLAMPMMLVTVGAYRRFMKAKDRRAGLRYCVITSVFLLLSFFTHAHVFLLSSMLLVVLWLLYVEDFWDGAFKLAPFAPSMTFFMPWFIVYFIENVPSSSGVSFGSADNFFGPKYYNASKLISTFFNYVSNYFHRPTDDTVFLVVMLLVMVLLIVRRAPRVPAGERRKLRYFDIEILTVVLAVSVIVLPHHIQAQSIVSLRHILPALLLFFAWPVLDDAPRRIKWTTMAALFVTCVVSIGVVTDGFLRFDREIDGYPALFDTTLGGKRLLKVAQKQNSKVVNTGAFWHIHHLYGVTKGGVSNAEFAERPHNPIGFRPGMTPPKMGPDFTQNPAWRYYDYVLVRREPASDISRVKDSLEQISFNRGWTLYRTIDWPAPRNADLEPVANPRRKFFNGLQDYQRSGTGSRYARPTEDDNDVEPVGKIPGDVPKLSDFITDPGSLVLPPDVRVMRRGPGPDAGPPAGH